MISAILFMFGGMCVLAGTQAAFAHEWTIAGIMWLAAWCSAGIATLARKGGL